MSIRSKLLSVLMWSVISAAFIGPGTLATAAAAGAAYKFQLVWALAFATIGCIVLQEMASRLTIVSGQEIATILYSRGGWSKWIAYFFLVVILIGCGAYEAGNILGSVAGVSLFLVIDRTIITMLIGALCFIMLWRDSPTGIAKGLGVIVAGMGILFFVTAIFTPAPGLVKGFVPTLPANSEWLILGLIGTTVVPYNIFLGAGLSRGQDVSYMRFGLIISVVLGGIISIAILIVGSQFDQFNSFSDLALGMGDRLGKWAQLFLAGGLFAAGFTSAVAAPLAAGLLFKSVIKAKSVFWPKMVSISILMIGLLFGHFDVKPIPVIIAAQVLNGMILPLITALLIILSNDRSLLSDNVNSGFLNGVSFLVLNLMLLIGFNSITSVVDRLVNLPLPEGDNRLLFIQLVAVPFLIMTAYKTYQARKVKVN